MGGGEAETDSERNVKKGEQGEREKGSARHMKLKKKGERDTHTDRERDRQSDMIPKENE